ncbi:hemagglutinin repeat-containing protein [Acinetobacter sp. MD2(2019)]|uniref:hemagglutinin repeat-containing protein n=1 Tax=Acinetobacter sp. MD2(2019) TaxID=2605273 RepID=UPI002D79D472|nr:hemagglutinin repeat-containing protein [Acinetobacter sp. MD2(2019)]
MKSFERSTTKRSGNKSEGFNAGVVISYGSSGLAFGITAMGNVGKGAGNGDETSHLNSQTNISSCNATNIIKGNWMPKH